MNHDMVAFTLDNWTPIWRRRQHVMSRFARKRRVLFIPPPVSLWSLLDISAFFSKEGREKIGRIFRPLRQPLSSQNLTVVYLKRLLPGRFEKFSLLKKINRRFFLFQLEAVQKKITLHSPILWIQRVEAADLASAFGRAPIIYDNTEDWLEFFSSSRKAFLKEVEQWDRFLMREASLVLTVSENLYQKKRAIHSETHLIQNGVDFDHFYRSSLKETTVAPEVENFTSPVLGYVGWISSRFDFSLLEEMATKRPHWTFLLVGPLHEEGFRDRFTSFNNVHFIGAVPYWDLHRFIKKFDVCIIPHILNELTASMNPLKLFEFLATGKPIVTTEVGGVDQFSSLLHICSGGDEFVDKIDYIVENKGDSGEEERIKEARKNSWDSRVEEIENLITRVIDKNEQT